MALFTNPPKYNFAGNFQKIEVESRSAVDFKLYEIDGTISRMVVDSTYQSVDSIATIELCSFFETTVKAKGVTTDELSSAVPSSYQFAIDGMKSNVFYVLPGGLGDDSMIAEAFVPFNFLTWQPQILNTTTKAPQWLRYVAMYPGRMYARLYYSDKSSDDQVEMNVIDKDCIYTANVSYGIMLNLSDKTKTLAAYDVWMEFEKPGATAPYSSYVQRYMCKSEPLSADWFVFVNTLGGIDSVCYTGELINDNDLEITTAKINNVTVDFDTKTSEKLTKSTGFLDSDNRKSQALEFIRSSARFYIIDGEMLPIHMIDAKLSTKKGELGGFDFTFGFSKARPYINIARSALPNNLVFEDVDLGELFFLAPRLEIYPHCQGEDIVFPVQQRFGNEWRHLTLQSLRALVGSSGPGPGGSYPPEIHAASHCKDGLDPVTPKEIGAHPEGGLKELDFVCKTIDAEKVITPEITSPAHAGGSLGNGFRLYFNADGDSVIEADIFHGRKEAIFNVVTIAQTRSVGAETLQTYASAVLVAVAEKQDSWRCYYDSKSGGQYWMVGDQAMRKTFTGLAGDTLKYYWRLVTAVGGEELGGKTLQWVELSKEVAEGEGVPEVGDECVGLGHRGEDRRRKNAKLISAFGEKGVEEISYANIDGFSLVGKETAYQSPERWRIASQRFELVAGDGIVYPIVVERGAWSEAQAPYYYYDRVSHGGNIYLCIDKRLDGTTVEPAVDQHAVWLCEVRKGDDGAKGDKGDQGAAAPRLKTQFSINGTTAWHEAYAAGDAYRRESNDNGVTWSVAMRMVGEGGTPGADGKKTPYTDFSYAYGLSQPTVWLDAPPSKVEGQHLWERIQKYTPKADNSGWALASTSYAIINEFVQIGGRNYALNTSEERRYIYWNLPKCVFLLSPKIIDKEIDIIITFWEKDCESDTLIGLGWGSASEWGGVHIWHKNSTPGKKQIKARKPAGVEAIWCFKNSLSTTYDFSVQTGDKEMDWSPAPEDTEVTAEKIITEINMSDDTLLLKAEKIELIGKSISAGKMQINPKTGDVIMNDVTMNNANVSGKVTASSGSIANMLAVSNNQLRSGDGMLNISQGKADATKPGLTRCDNIAEGYISRSIGVTAGAGATAFAPVVLNNQTAGRFEFSVAVMLTSSYSGTVSIGMRLNGGDVLTLASGLVAGGGSSSQFVTVEYMLPEVNSEITFLLQCTKQYNGYAHLFLRKEPTATSPFGIYYDNRDKNIFQEFGVMHKYGNGQLYLTSLEGKDPEKVDSSEAEGGMVVGGCGLKVRSSGISMIVDNQERCLSNVDVLYASTSVSVTDKYNVVMCNNGSGITVTLPANPTTGRMIYVHQVIAGNTVTINGNGKGIDATSSGQPRYTIQAREGVTVALIYDGVKWFGFKMSNIR